MPNHIICRRTGETVATGYLLIIMSKGLRAYRFYHRFENKDMCLTKAQFDANYRIERVEYK